MIKNVTIGADPELFIINSKTGKVVSSIGLIPGEKGNAYRTKDMPKGYGLQIDNILGEFNIPPVKMNELFTENYLHHINYMKDFIRNYVQAKNPDLDILCKASMIVDEDQLQSDEAKLFGCSKDYNAYTMDVNPKPDVPTDGLRSAGCHIHIGYDNPNVNDSINLVKYLDAYLGVPSVIIDPDVRRRSLYGKAGCFRLTDYGVEYRVLSSYFISSDEVIRYCCRGISTALSALCYGGKLPKESDVISTINNSNVEKAKVLCSNLKIDYTL